eukprot:m.191012 g.191012  ORF g.191012 m.191012 type:complete len:317 (+) comp18203_c0_seq1:335-1285(+)
MWNRRPNLTGRPSGKRPRTLVPHRATLTTTRAWVPQHRLPTRDSSPIAASVWRRMREHAQHAALRCTRARWVWMRTARRQATMRTVTTVAAAELHGATSSTMQVVPANAVVRPHAGMPPTTVATNPTDTTGVRRATSLLAMGAWRNRRRRTAATSNGRTEPRAPPPGTTGWSTRPTNAMTRTDAVDARSRTAATTMKERGRAQNQRRALGTTHRLTPHGSQGAASIRNQHTLRRLPNAMRRHSATRGSTPRHRARSLIVTNSVTSTYATKTTRPTMGVRARTGHKKATRSWTDLLTWCTIVSCAKQLVDGRKVPKG